MTQRWLRTAGALFAIAVTAAACGGSNNSSSSAPAASGAGSGGSAPATSAAAEVLGGTMPTSIGAGEGHLNLVVWPGYAEDGSNDPNYNWVGPFQQETGCQVTSKVAATSDEMVQLMHTGQYDGVSASGNASTRLILAGDAAPVNVDLVKNYTDLSGFLKDQPYNTYKGTHYGIPHGWGANLLMWRPDKVNPAPDSWGAVFDANSPYKGKVTAYDDPIYIADAALYLKATKPDLKITDPYELTNDQFNAAVDLLKVQRGLIGQYWNDYTKLISASTAGDTVIGTSWQIIANLINADPKNPPVKAIVPKEGSTGWSDTWMVYSKAKNPNCMYLWLDYITRPDVQSQVATYFGEAPANPKACDVIAKSDATFCDTFHATDQAFYDSVAFWKVPLPDCGDSRGTTCKGYDAWLQAWQSIKG
jgi:putative spermidine/putrescine transport system substrate-binding protein